MLAFLLLPCLYLPIANGYAILRRDEPQLTDGAKEALEGAGIDITKPHVRPKQVQLT